MPLTAGKLRRLGRSNHPYVDRNIGAVFAVIKTSIENASDFESVAEQLQKPREEMASVQNTIVADESENLLNAVDPVEVDTVTAQESIKMECLNEMSVESAECTMNFLHVMDEPAGAANGTVENGSDGQNSHVDLSGQAGELKKELNDHQVELPQEKFVHTGQMGTVNMKMELDTEDMPVALSKLKNPKRNNKSLEKPQESEPVLQLKPFDYAAAREHVNFGGRREKKKTVVEEEDGNKNLPHSKERCKNSASSRVPRVEGTSEFAPARRGMALPPTGNRSATFR